MYYAGEKEILENVIVVKQYDLKVFKVKYESQAEENDDKWFFVDNVSQYRKKVLFVEYESQTDLKVYFVEYESQSGGKIIPGNI